MSETDGKGISSPNGNSVNETFDKVEETNEKSEGKMAETATLNTTASEDSEYETLEEDNGRSSRSSGSRRSSRSRRSSFSDDLSDDIAIEDEREDGDGQEENSVGKDKKLDDDEDKRNPQYIPKKGTFYEHDDRTMVDENEMEGKENETNRRDPVEAAADAAGAKKTGGKVWTEKVDRWTHDLYNEDEQKPKSTQELIDTYGYDIRNEEAPPKARRRRRYGRGPNKYTRNWEDEEAYTRAAPQRRVFHNNKEDFPDLGSRGRNRDKVQPGSKSPSAKSKSKSPAPRQPPVEAKQQPTGENHRDNRERSRGENNRDNRERSRGERNRDHRARSSGESNRDTSRGERPRRERGERERGAERGRGLKESPPTTIPASQDRHSTPTQPNNLPPQTIVVEKDVVRTPGDREGERRVGRGRGFRGTGKPRPTMEFTSSRGRAPLPPAFNREPVNNHVDDSLKHAAEMLVQDFSHIYINNNNNNNTNIVEETIIPRSERRSHNRDGDGGESGGGRSKRYSTQRQRSLPETTPPPTYSPPHNIPYYTQPPPPPSSYVPTPVYNEVTGAMMAFLPPGPPPAAPAAPPYPPPPLLNYMPPPAFPPLTMQPPQISGQFDDPCGTGAELYQGQGGITYYSPQSQSVVPRPNPPRRVKLAIPIVPPPDNKQQAPSAAGGKQRSGSGGGQDNSHQTQEMQPVVT